MRLLFRSRPLLDGVDIELPTLQRGLLERRIPDRQRVEVGLDAPALAVRRLHRAMPARRQAELLQHLAVELQGDRLLARQPAHRLGVGEIALVGELEVELVGRQRVRPEAAVLDVALELVRVRLAGAVRSEEHTSELQSLMRISYAVFCLKKKKKSK